MAMMDNGAGGILSYFTRHRTAANLLMVLMVVAGLVAIPKMRAQFFPDVVSETVRVSVAWDGAGAEDVDRGIVQILEPALLAVDGVTASTSRSTEGSATIALEFETNYDLATALTDVEDAIDSVSTLPDDADDPVIRSGGWSDDVTDVVITGPVGVDQLSRFADEMVARLFAEGVTSTSIQGIVAPQTLIEVTSLSLIQHDITISEIASAIAAEVNADPVGDLDGASRIRAGTEKRSAEELSAIVLRTDDDNSELTVGDVATITVEGPDRERAYYHEGNPAVLIAVTRSASGDAIGLQRSVEQVADEMRATLPSDVSVDLINTRAEMITGRLNILMENGAQGLFLVMVLLFLFLSARTALWVAMGIPVSMLAAVALMYSAGITINMISLFALIITLGIVVDDAIVVAEHADFRSRRYGEDGPTAAETAARRMFSPVFSATITTNIAFFGLIMIGGRFGELIADIPFTVIVVLTASLVECFIVLPHHMSHSVGAHLKNRWYDLPSTYVNRGFDWFRRTAFRPFMAWVVRGRYVVIAAALALLSTQAALFIKGDVQWRFFSSPERGQVSGNIAMLASATREDTEEMLEQLSIATMAVAQQFEDETGVNPVDYILTEIGGNSGRGLQGSDTKESYQLGAITIELVDADLRPTTSNEFVTAVQQAVVATPMTETVSFRSWGAGPGGNSLEIQLSGADADTLKEASLALQTELGRFGEISGLEDSLAYDKEELVLELTPQGQALGFDIETLGAELRRRLAGVEAATYPDGTRSAAIRVEIPEGEITADFLDRVLMRSDAGEYLPLADIVTVSRETGFSTVRRENGIMLISVTGDLDDDDADRATEIQQVIDEEILPTIESRYGVSAALGGLSEQEQEFLSDAQTGLVFILTGIYLTLAWIFGSWTRPLVVMSIIPFSLVGTIYGHNAWGIPMSMFTVVGLLGMVGIVINDSIVLVTTVDEYARDRGLIPAIIDGVSDRLRAVMLTTATTVLGLLPLLYEGSSQAEFLKPTVITLVYGLSFGMIMVLLIVPSFMAIQADIASFNAAARRGIRSKARAIQLPTVIGAVLVAVLLSVIVLPVAFMGAPLSQALPATTGAAIGLFLLMLGIGLALIYGIAMVMMRRAA
ncbi:acriflavine resistance protein B [Marivivens niveibacter]|uniref:Acriflavine resistance protein B n=1 Tax=Marivivens niveibacter TaxID=1930667 RepID=A0A251X0H5_9RHOB|nr:efflux RND transporter permease subunit [Marivivens niveibacter]OUD10086.1 acriflavine resistance protein B [Marivivens niveibacter]